MSGRLCHLFEGGLLAQHCHGVRARQLSSSDFTLQLFLYSIQPLLDLLHLPANTPILSLAELKATGKVLHRDFLMRSGCGPSQSRHSCTMLSILGTLTCVILVLTLAKIPFRTPHCSCQQSTGYNSFQHDAGTTLYSPMKDNMRRWGKPVGGRCCLQSF